MPNAQQVEILRNGPKAWNNWRADNPQQQVDLTQANLCGLDLRGVDLRGANIRGANFTKAKMNGANLEGVRSANLTVGPLWPARILRYIYLWRVPIFFAFGVCFLNLLVLGTGKIPWSIATLASGIAGFVAKFRASVQDVAEDCANLSEADLSGANLSQADLTGARFERAILVQADLSGAKLVRASLREANITSLAAVQGADLRLAEVGSAGAQVANAARVNGQSPYSGMQGPPLPPAAFLQYLYLLRVPILVGATLFFLPIISLTTARQLLGNLFVLERWDIFWTIFAALLLAFSVLVTFRVVLLNGMERFGIQQALTLDKISRRALFLSELLILPIMVAAIFSNGQAANAQGLESRLLWAVAALLAAHIAGFIVLLLAVWFSPKYPTPADDRFPVRFTWMKTLLRKAYEKEWVSNESRQKWGSRFKRLPLPLRVGYFDSYSGLPYPGQLLSFGLLLLTIGVYWGIGFFKHQRLGQDPLPAICYVLLLLLLLNWILGLAAFFLDRYRIPLLALLALLIWRGDATPQSDHYYNTLRGGLTAVRPEIVLHAASRLAPDSVHPRGHVVLVATAGGGIQAAAWTAQVLTGLQSELHAVPSNQRANFADSIALVSSVSGGAVGTMFFSSAYQNTPGHPGFSVDDAQLDTIVNAAEAPSLDDIAWGLAYPDFWRIFFPYTKTEQGRLIDRGAALEEAWSNRGGGIHSTLNAWREGVQDGWRPALIFNSTQVETGQPLLLATTDMPSQIPTFSSSAPNSDISVVTAVRLAATFPYVSPAAKAISDSPPYHLVDGGYYDNYGVYSLLEWLNQALASSEAAKTPDILIIQIRSFPEDASAPAQNQGWFYQTWAPVQTLLSVRSTAQLVRDQDALTNFTALWSGKGFRISQATFEFPGTDAPLSWRMNAAQIEDVTNAWRDQIRGPKNQEWLKVKCFFYGMSGECGGRQP